MRAPDVTSGNWDHHEANADKMPKKMLDHMEIRPGVKGGATVEHVHTSMMHPNVVHVFGKNEGEKMSAHIMKHAKMAAPAASEGEPAEVEDAEAGPDAHPGMQG